MNQSEAMDLNAKSRSKRASKKLRRISIESAKNGGHTVEHHFDHSDGPYREPEQHVFGKGEHEAMLAHVANALKLPEPKDGEGDEGGAEGAAY
jgi:hypothetical protein